MPITPVEDKVGFIACLEECVDNDKTYWDESIRDLKKS